MTPYEYIKKEIILGNLKPGQIFNEQDVASALGLSRTPVREAVLKLNEEGLLTIIPRKGTIVSQISITDVKEVYGARSLIEPEIVEKAVDNMDRDLLIKWKNYFNNIIENNLDDLELPVEKDYLDDIDKGFHLSIVNSLKNKLLSKEIEHLMDLSIRIRYLSNMNNQTRYIESLKEHVEIIDSILDKNHEKAKDAMIKHLKNTIEGYKLWI